MGIKKNREKSKAIQIAIRAIQLQMKKIVFEASLGINGSDNPYHQKCKDDYLEMENAIKTLSMMR